MLDVLITGVTSGLLYGLLGFAIVVLFRMTGIANFAAGSLATLGAVAVYELAERHRVPLLLAVVLAVVTLGGLGLITYLIVLRHHDDAGPLNLTVRTLGLYLLLAAATDKLLGQGQPFNFPQIFPVRRVSLGPVRVPESGLGVLGVALVLTAGFAALFRYSSVGLMLRGMAADRETARLLGADVRRLEAIAWMLTTALAAVVGILTAPATLVSSDMMDSSLLYVFAAVVTGGLTSLGGAFVGGVSVGITQGVAYYYGNADLALLAVFGLFLATLIVRPHGLFGERIHERL